MATNGRQDGKPGAQSPKTVRSIHLVVLKALADAHRKGVVTRNVATVADPPSLGLVDAMTSRPGTPASFEPS